MKRNVRRVIFQVRMPRYHGKRVETAEVFHSPLRRRAPVANPASPIAHQRKELIAAPGNFIVFQCKGLLILMYRLWVSGGSKSRRTTQAGVERRRALDAKLWPFKSLTSLGRLDAKPLCSSYLLKEGSEFVQLGAAPELDANRRVAIVRRHPY